MKASQVLKSNISGLGKILLNFSEEDSEKFDKIVQVVYSTLDSKKCVFWCGNGGSAAESLHLAAEFVGRFKNDRSPLPSISLNSDISVLTAISNDYGFEKVFARQLEALGEKGDTLILLTTSGDSPNIIEAIKMADALRVNTIAFLGKSGGKALNLVSDSIIIDSFDTARIQEMHLLLGHTICEYVDIKNGLGSK